MSTEKNEPADGVRARRELIAKAIYELEPFYEGGEYVDGFQVSPGGSLSWEQALARDAEFADDEIMIPVTKSAFDAADAVIGALRVEQRAEGASPDAVKMYRDACEAKDKRIAELEARLAEHVIPNPRTPPQTAGVTDADVERTWIAMVGADVAPICHQASIVRGDIRTALESFALSRSQAESVPAETEWLLNVLKKIEYASRKDSLTDAERLDSVRIIVRAALTRPVCKPTEQTDGDQS